MRVTNLKRSFLCRKILLKREDHYTEVETNVLVGIYLMNNKYLRCSGNTLFKYLSTVHRTPYKKTLFITLKKFKQDGMINKNGKGLTKIYLTLKGELHLFELERLIMKVRFE